MRLAADIGGREGDGRVLVLLHGMGATGEVWRPLIRVLEPEWNGRWIAPDLRGHGRSPHATSYALAEHAADVAETMRVLAPDARDVFIIGHSMGGAIALALASGEFGVRPCATMGLGIKIAWTPAELDGLNRLANAPLRQFENREAAVSFYMKVSGLVGLVTPGDEIAQAGVSDDGRSLRADNFAASIGPPPMEALAGSAKGSVFLAVGERDPMCTLSDALRYCNNSGLVVGTGHNAMVEKPELVWAWMKLCLESV